MLTPGVGNSAYFEHAFLAREMGVALVEGRDLLVHDNVVYMRTTAGLRRVDVIYRRVDDDFLDPLAFRRDSHLGVAGLLNAYRAGTVSLANAIGTGIADDKALYAYIPAIIRFYLSRGADPRQRRHVSACRIPSDRQLRARAPRLAGGQGGGRVGRLRHAGRAAQHGARARGVPRQDPGGPAQLHRPADAGALAVAVLHRRTIEPRHVDLRPYVLYGETVTVVPGGLTRVALKKGSLVVNSSQGGGSKDTWVLAE